MRDSRLCLQRGYHQEHEEYCSGDGRQPSLCDIRPASQTNPSQCYGLITMADTGTDYVMSHKLSISQSIKQYIYFRKHGHIIITDSMQIYGGPVNFLTENYAVSRTTGNMSTHKKEVHKTFLRRPTRTARTRKLGTIS